jgi:hypothetical protein
LQAGQYRTDLCMAVGLMVLNLAIPGFNGYMSHPQ